MYSTPYLLKYIQAVFDILVLDGAGQERDTEFTRHEIGSLVRRRYENERTVIITSSLPPIDFIRRYGERVKGAITEMETFKVDTPRVA
jgi:DNA replication protein DnaC